MPFWHSDDTCATAKPGANATVANRVAPASIRRHGESLVADNMGILSHSDRSIAVAAAQRNLGRSPEPPDQAQRLREIAEKSGTLRAISMFLASVSIMSGLGS